MKALIIEDETAAALNLKAILKQAAPDIRVVDTLESVEESVDWLRANPQPDLLFMDIHLPTAIRSAYSTPWRSRRR